MLIVRQRQFIRKSRHMAFLNTVCEIKTNPNTNPNPKIRPEAEFDGFIPNLTVHTTRDFFFFGLEDSSLSSS